ncbi:MAG: class I SAM-dependent methyltransferase [Planctomycetota bacterium]
MRAIDLNELAKWSPWPERIMGLAAWNAPIRTMDKMEEEYNRDKYARCREYLLSSGGAADIESIKRFGFGGDPGRDVCVARGNDVFVASLEEARSAMYSLLQDEMRDAIRDSAGVVELGCGYGYNLHLLAQSFPGKLYRGGEYSTNAVALAQRLFSQDGSVEVREFNFLDATSYSLFDDLDGSLTVFTCHSVEQIPSAANLLSALQERAGKIGTVFHFEPAYEVSDSSLIALMRRRYAQICDYNRDLV